MYSFKQKISGHFFLEAIDTIKTFQLEVFLAITLGAFAVSTMFFYDYVMLRYLKADIPVQKIFRISWIANTLNGFIGFGGLVGAGVRTMLYRPYIKKMENLLKVSLG